MKTILYYFSGTGNSLKVARDLASELRDTDIVSIPKAASGGMTVDRIGIVYPVYMFGMPLIVTSFLKQLQVPGDTYIFAVATFGGTAGAALQQTAAVLKERSLRLSAGFLVKMPGNYTPFYGAIPEERQQKMFAEEKRLITSIAETVKAGTVLELSSGPRIKNALMSGIRKIGSSRIPQMDRGFWSDGKCNSCGICARVCPVKNIEIIDGKPRWLGHCEQCMACLQWCPQQAVQYKKSTSGRKRYHHPDITTEDIIAGAR